MSMPSQEVSSIMENPVIAAVCDIRGFTDFTATVDAVNLSEQVHPNIKDHLLKAYAELVKETQHVAVRKLLGPVAKDLREGGRLKKAIDTYYGETKRRNLTCALKSTGDGFLVAFALEPTQQSHKPYGNEVQRALAQLLTKSLVALVDSSARGKFRSTLSRFLKVWQEYLALRLEPEAFRVAGAIALGTGQLVTDKVPKGWVIWDVIRNKNVDPQSHLELMSDAYGHGVNLAFRICDRAGRGSKQPYVLLDRRVGQLLIEQVKQRKGPWFYRKTCLPGFALNRFRFEEPLKGIDELWCYALEEFTSTKGPREGSAKKKRRKL